MRILIVRNNSNSQAVDASLLLATYLATQGLDYTLVDSSDLSCRCDMRSYLASTSGRLCWEATAPSCAGSIQASDSRHQFRTAGLSCEHGR